MSMAVVAILLAAGMPGLQQSSERVQMQVWSERILMLLQQRKTVAMAENQQITITMDSIATELPSGLSEHNFRAASPLVSRVIAALRVPEYRA